MKDIESLEKKIGVKFKNKDLLKQAMVHRSYLNENRDFELDHNERMEFLGDAVLELIVTEYLYGNFSNPEGELTNYRAALVNGKMLAKISKGIGLDEYLMMSRGETKDLGKARQYLLANALEAVIGAIYLDQGYKKSEKFITKFVLSEMDNVLSEKLYQDPKSKFQEEAQEKAGVTPIYKVIKEWGPDHDRRFVIGIYLENEKIAEGEGSSKQAAQRNAAKKGLEVKGWE
ncbi:MAG: ribonuclease III [Candidatus Pacebacteria bacterium]|nr:ribonuclease III [Candidatus Paceibacterota bacterium]